MNIKGDRMVKKIIRLVMVGILVVELDMEAYFNFLKSVKSEIEEKIANMPEFKEKRKGIEVVFSARLEKERQTNNNGDAIEKMMQVDIREITRGIESPEEARKILVDAAIDAVQKELPNIEASPAEPELAAKIELGAREKKPWWKLW